MLWKRLSASALLLLVIGLGGGCDELLQNNNDNDDPLAALVGTWITTAHTMVNTANTAQQVDLYALGYRVTLIVESDGSYTITFTDPEGSDTDTGTLTVTESEIIVTSDGGGSLTLSYVLVGGILTLTDTSESYDFDDDGTDEAATTVMVFQHPGSSGDLTLSDLAGSFMANTFVITDQANASNSYDMISRGGFYTLVLDASGNTQVVMLFPGDEDGVIHLTGTSTLSGDGTTLTTDFPGTEADGTVTVTVEGTSVTLTRSDVTWDFGSGEVPATFTISLIPVTGPAMTDLDGYWKETSQLLINPENTSQTYDDIGRKIAMTVQMTSGGIFRMWDLGYRESDSDESFNDIGEDTYTLIGNVIKIGTTDPILVQLTESGDDIILHGFDHHDFDEDGTSEWAAIQLTFEPITEHAVSDLEGAWATTAWTYVGKDDPSTTIDTITDRLDIVTWVFDSSGGFEVVQSRVGEDLERFSGTAELFGNICRIDGGEGDYMYTVFDLSGSALEISMTDWADPFGTGTSESWRVDVQTESFTPAVSAEFEGTWGATQFVFSDPYGVLSPYDVLAAGGSFDFQASGEGTCHFEVYIPNEVNESDNGTWEIFGDLIIITADSDGEVSVFQYTIGANVNTLYCNNNSWDLDGDGTDDPALLNITMVPPGNN